MALKSLHDSCMFAARARIVFTEKETRHLCLSVPRCIPGAEWVWMIHRNMNASNTPLLFPVFLEGSFPSLISVSLLIKRGNNKPISGGRVLNNIWNEKSVDTHKRKSLLFPILVFSVSFRCEGECQVHKALAFLKSVASESGACGKWMSGHHSE